MPAANLSYLVTQGGKAKGSQPGPTHIPPWGGPTHASNLCPHRLPCRDRRSTGLKLSKKKARRRHTDVRSRQAGRAGSRQPLPFLFPEPQGQGWGRGGPVPPSPPCLASQPCPPWPRWGMLRSICLLSWGSWGPPWDRRGLGDPCAHSPAGVPIWGPGVQRGRDERCRTETPVLSGPKQGVLHPEI